MNILQRYTITTDDHRTRTRFTFFESMVRIDTLVVSNRKIEGDDEGARQRFWRGKWFIKMTAYIPNAHIVASLKQIANDDSTREYFTNWLEMIQKQDEEKNKKSHR